MSIRLIGQNHPRHEYKYNTRYNQSNNYTKKKQDLTRAKTYKEQLDRQVEQNKKRKLQQKKKQQMEDFLREVQFYQDFKNDVRRNQENEEKKQEQYRFASTNSGKKTKFINAAAKQLSYSPAFSPKKIPSQIIHCRDTSESERRIKQFQQELDLRLADIYMKIQISKKEMNLGKQFETFKRKIKTQPMYCFNQQLDSYNLPYHKINNFPISNNFYQFDEP